MTDLERHTHRLSEPSTYKEILYPIENFFSFWHGHGYQPWRRLWFKDDKNPIYDITQPPDGRRLVFWRRKPARKKYSNRLY